MNELFVEIGHPATTKLHYEIHVGLGNKEPTREIAHKYGKQIRKEVAENAFALNFSFGVAWTPAELFFAVFLDKEDENPVVASANWFTRRIEPQKFTDEQVEQAAKEAYAEWDRICSEQADRFNGEIS